MYTHIDPREVIHVKAIHAGTQQIHLITCLAWHREGNEHIVAEWAIKTVIA